MSRGRLTRDGYTLNVTQIVPSGVEYTRSDGVHGGNLTQYEVNFHELNSGFMIGDKKAGRGEMAFQHARPGGISRIMSTT